MEYRILLKMVILEFDLFIELAKNYEIKIHPNLTDEIYVDSYFCKIDRIHVDLDHDGCSLIYLTVEDPTWIMKDKDKEYAIEVLRDEINDMKKYDWILNDYSKGIKE